MNWDYAIVYFGIAVLILVPVCIPWWINHCDKIGVEKARQRMIKEQRDGAKG